MFINCPFKEYNYLNNVSTRWNTEKTNGSKPISKPKLLTFDQ